jgi:hypothetical protein
MIPTIYTRDQRDRFFHLFGRNLHHFWSNITGFELVDFDKDVVKPDDANDESTRDALLRQHGENGEEAVALIMELIDHPLKGETCRNPK